MRTFAQTQKPPQEAKPPGSSRPVRGFSGQGWLLHPILQLPRVIAAQAVRQSFQGHAQQPEAGPAVLASRSPGHNFTTLPLRPKTCAGIQAKLAVGQPNDSYEQEADRIADRIMRLPEPRPQRACACGGACPKCQMEHAVREDKGLQTKALGARDPCLTAAPPIVTEVLKSPGHPLDPATRAFMEPRFGHDFSRVRIHTDARAAESAQAVSARAYTVGRDVVFGTRRYAPGTSEGRWLVAHELVHIVQQGAGASVVLQRRPDDEAQQGDPANPTTAAPSAAAFDVAEPSEADAQETAAYLGSKRSPTRTACTALKSMIRSTLALCSLTGEDSTKCEEACAKVRVHAGKLLHPCNLDMPKIDFKEHKTSGEACGSGAALGVGKPFPLTNAAEVIHHVRPYARCFFSDYEVRRTIEDKSYEQVGGVWRVLASTPAGTDDPPGLPAGSECVQPPVLYSYDSPGWFLNVRELSVGGGVKVSKSATRVEARMNFLEWISAKGPRIKVQSDKIEWSNVLKLKWAGKGWKIEPGSAVALGHVTL